MADSKQSVAGQRPGRDPGDAVMSWATRNLGDLCGIESALVDPKSPDFRDRLHVGGANMTSATGELLGLKTAREEGLISGKYAFDDTMVLYSKIRPYLQKVARPMFSGLCSADVYPLSPQDGLLTRDFLYYLLLSPTFTEYAISVSARAGMPKVNRSQLFSFAVALPSLPEQKRIVAILDEAFAAIATATAHAEKNRANARELFEVNLKQLFSHKQDVWAEQKLASVCEFASGGTPSKKKAEYWSGEIPWVSGRDMKSTRVSDTTLHISQEAVDESSTRMVFLGSLLILVRGMGLAHGAQIVEVMVPCAFNQDIRAITPQHGVLSRYLLFALRTRINMSHSVLSNAAHGTLKINMEGLKDVEIPIPPADDQLRIVTQIDSLSESTCHLESVYQQKLTALTELKQSILHKAFTGELTADRKAADRTLSEAKT